jgi:hypothetical protein
MKLMCTVLAILVGLAHCNTPVKMPSGGSDEPLDASRDHAELSDVVAGERAETVLTFQEGWALAEKQLEEGSYEDAVASYERAFENTGLDDKVPLPCCKIPLISHLCASACIRIRITVLPARKDIAYELMHFASAYHDVDPTNEKGELAKAIPLHARGWAHVTKGGRAVGAVAMNYASAL